MFYPHFAETPCKATITDLLDVPDIVHREVQEKLDHVKPVWWNVGLAYGLKVDRLECIRLYSNPNNTITEQLLSGIKDKTMEDQDEEGKRICKLLRELHCRRENHDSIRQAVNVIYMWHKKKTNCAVCTLIQFPGIQS